MELTNLGTHRVVILLLLMENGASWKRFLAVGFE